MMGDQKLTVLLQTRWPWQRISFKVDTFADSMIYAEGFATKWKAYAAVQLHSSFVQNYCFHNDVFVESSVLLLTSGHAYTCFLTLLIAFVRSSDFFICSDWYFLAIPVRPYLILCTTQMLSPMLVIIFGFVFVPRDLVNLATLELYQIRYRQKIIL